MKDWEAFEHEVAEFMHGKRQQGSGLSPIASKKGDIITQKFLIECKCTSKTDYHLQAKTFQKIIEQALQAHKMPLMAIRTAGADFFVSLEVDEVEPKNYKVIEKPIHSPFITISDLSIVPDTVYKTQISIPTKQIIYPVCIWRFGIKEGE